MNFSVSKESLTHLLYLTHSIVERKNTMPIIANVKLNAGGSTLTVSATDLEVSMVGETDATVITPGNITVDAKVLYEIVKELPNSPVTMSLNTRSRLEIECGRSRFKINGTSAEEFPNMAGMLLDNALSVDAQKFYEMFNKTAFAVSTDETRFNITGVYVESLDGVHGRGSKYLRFVATDGHRLSVIDRPADGFSLEQGVIIPRKGINEIRKVLEANEGAATIAVNNGFFTVRSMGVTLGVRLVDGQFPDYKRAIPLESKTLLEVRRQELLSAVKRVSLITTDKTKTLKCKLMDGNLLISSSSPEYGEASESVLVKQDGENTTVGFSACYLLELLAAMADSESIMVGLNGERGPGVFKSPADEHFTCVVMPMRFE